MSHLLVYATTESRLHADLVVVRLKRAGIATSSISILHPESLRPNSAVCWMNGSAFLHLPSGQRVSVSGSLSRSLKEDGGANGASFADRMGGLGLDHRQRSSLEESLLENRIVITVEVHDEFEMPAIYHTLRGLAVQKVSTADVAHKGSAVATRSHRYHP
ncbi:MAG TPA: hypothetical protein VII09_08565, partial [Opitutaceae bacterium]